jgi:prohibitin 2
MFVKQDGTLNASRVALIAGLVVGALLIAIFWPFRTVPTGFRGVITQFGKIESIAAEGLHFIPPYQTLNLFNVRAEAAEITKAQGSTWDDKQGIGIPVDVDLVVRYAIQPDRIAEVFEKYSKDGNLDSFVETAAKESFKAVTARYTAPDLISKRTQVSAEIRDQLDKKLSLYGAKVITIDTKDFQFDKGYMDIVRQKSTQEQQRMLEQNKLLTIETQQAQKVKVAEAEATAARAKADGEAYATTKNAEAQANALRLKNAAVRESKDVLELERIAVSKIQAEKWNGVMPPINAFGSGPVPVMNYPVPAPK